MGKIKLPLLFFILSTLLFLTSCEVVGDIFEAGMWFGVIGVVLVVGLVIWLLGRFRR